MTLPVAYRAPPRRISYVVPFSTGPDPPRLAIPAPGAARHPDRHGDSRPLILREPNQGVAGESNGQADDDGHPKHCLGINALALDTSTVLAGSSKDDGGGKRKRTPEGILYTGGRDGLIAAWELGLPTRRRKRRYGVYGTEKENRGRAGVLSKPSDDDDDDESGDESDSDDEDAEEAVRLLDEEAEVPRRTRPLAQGRRRSSGMNGKEREYDPDIPFVERWEVNHERLSVPSPRSTFRQCVQSHTDWCNDMLLCNYNQTVISASSDRTLKSWSPHLQDQSMAPVTVGTHTDYVRCLAHGRETAWVASAGLDKRLKLWDIAESRKVPIANFPEDGMKASIYSLATNPTGTLLASGSPERVVRLWDPRSSAKLFKLVGHTDNVRSLLLSEDGRYLLSASSDATVKLWSVGMQRCIHTFSYPSAAVWSLWTQHPSLEVFYSGDRAGYVCKVDLEGCGDPSEGECVVLCKVDEHDLCESGATAHCGDEAINRIVGADDTFIWTATGSSAVLRWRDVRPRWERRSPLDCASAGGDVDGISVPSPPFHALASSPARASVQSQPFSHRPTSTGDHSSPLSSPDRAYSGSGLGSVVGTSLTRSVSGASVAFVDHATVHPFRPGATPHSQARSSSSNPLAIVPQPSPVRKPQSVHSVSLHTPSGAEPVRDHRDGVPFESLVPLEPPDDLISGSVLHALGRHHRDPESGTLYSSASIHSVHSLARVSSAVSPPRLSYAIRGSSSSHNAEGSTPRRPLSPGPDHASAARPQAVHLYQLRDSAAEAIPLRDEPDEIIQGRAGLVRCEVLSDRRHVISVDTAGQLALWDIIRGLCLGTYSTAELTAARRPSAASSAGSSVASSSDGGPRQMLDALRDRIEGTASVMPWCMVETRTGQLTVHLEEGRCFEAEVYADEADLAPALLDELRDDHRISLGRWVLRNLFEGFIYQQLHRRHLETQQTDQGPATTRPSTGTIDGPPLSFSRAHPPHIKLPPASSRQTLKRASSGMPRTPGMTISIATPAATPALPPDLPTVPTRHFGDLTPIAGSPALAQSDNATPFAVPQSKRSVPSDYFSLDATSTTGPEEAARPNGSDSEAGSSRPDLGQSISNSASKLPTTPVNENLPSEVPTMPGSAGFLSRFRSFGRVKRATDKAAEDDSGEPASPRTSTADAGTPPESADPLAHLTPARRLQHQVVDAILARPIEPCGPMEAPPLTLPSEMSILISEESHDSGTWEVTYRGLVSTTEEDVDMLESVMPGWLLDFLLGNRFIFKEAPKVAFLLEPEGGAREAGLPDLPNGNARLTASRVLRMRKVCLYIAQKLDLDLTLPAGTPLSPLAPPQGKIASHSRQTSIVSNSSTPQRSIAGAPLSRTTTPSRPATAGDSTANGVTASPVPIRRAEEEIELLCNGQALSWSMSLGAVRQYVWGKGGDVVVSYRLANR